MRDRELAGATVRHAGSLPRARRPAEILSFYERGWKDMSRRFFPESPWPAESEVSPVVDGDKGFLALYGLLSHKHVLTTMDVAPTLGTFIAAWAAYRAFFALAETGVAIAVPPAWAYDIVSELAWHCQQYHELRLRALGLDRSADGAEVGGSADVDADTGGDGGAVELGEGVTETDVVGAWQLPEVLSLLHRAVDGSGIVASLAAGDPPLQADFRLALGYFSMVVLVRLYTKVGDYGSALELARPLNVVADEGPFARIARAHLSLQSYAAFACIMSRRMDDAFRICNRTLGSFQRSPSPVLQSDKEGGASVHFLLRKLGEKLLAMLALCSAVLPGATVDEVVRRALKDKHGDKIERISRAVATTSGSAADADAAAAADVAGLFAISAPGFLALSQTPAPSADVAALRAAGTYYAASALAATHLRALQRDIARRTAGLAQLRSILRLYTSIDIAKLAAYVGCSEETARCVSRCCEAVVPQP